MRFSRLTRTQSTTATTLCPWPLWTGRVRSERLSGRWSAVRWTSAAIPAARWTQSRLAPQTQRAAIPKPTEQIVLWQRQVYWKEGNVLSIIALNATMVVSGILFGGMHPVTSVIGRKEGNVLFNNTLNTFYLRLYGVGHMVKDHSDSERGNPHPPHRLLFPISSKGCFICIISQTGLHIPRPLLYQSWSRVYWFHNWLKKISI